VADSSVLLVGTGGLLAIAGGVATQLLQSRASGEARSEARRDARDDLQRAALLELQETAFAYGQALGKAHHSDVVAHKSGGFWGRQLLGPEIDDALTTNVVRLRLVMERIRDDELRALVDEFVSAGTAISSQASADAAFRAFSVAVAKHQALIRRSGEVLRPLL
jgi:hypothetical protein